MGLWVIGLEFTVLIDWRGFCICILSGCNRRFATCDICRTDAISGGSSVTNLHKQYLDGAFLIDFIVFFNLAII
jgi:hypothetical protein